MAQVFWREVRIDFALAVCYKPLMHALIYTLSAFALILILARLRVPLALSIFIGALTVGLLFGLSGLELIRSALVGVIQPRAVCLAATTMLILTLSGIMQTGGQMEKIVSLAQALLRRPVVTMAALPALIGLLPVPGGAVFSAPMVAAAAGRQTSSSVLSAVNYWYRHIWESWWPLYPGVMLTITLTAADYGTFVLYQFPLTISMVLAGLQLFRGTGSDLYARVAPAPPRTRRLFLWATASIWLVMIVWIPAHFVLRLPIFTFLPEKWAVTLEKFLPVIMGLLVSITWTALSNRVSPFAAVRIFARKNVLDMGLLVAAVMIFQYMLELVGANQRIAHELLALRVPVFLVVMILPYIAGLVTGMAVGFVGTSFPIVLALVAALPGNVSLFPYVALAYGFGHLGQMSSPIHLCLIVSNRYLKTDFAPVYHRLIPSLVITALLLLVYFAILHWAV